MDRSINVDCLFYVGDNMEDGDHLFFRCAFSQNIWKSIVHSCCFNWSVVSWYQEFQWAKFDFEKNTFWSTPLKIAWRVTVYDLERDKLQNSLWCPALWGSGLQMWVSDIVRSGFHHSRLLDKAPDNPKCVLICTNWKFALRIFSVFKDLFPFVIDLCLFCIIYCRAEPGPFCCLLIYESFSFIKKKEGKRNSKLIFINIFSKIQEEKKWNYSTMQTRGFLHD